MVTLILACLLAPEAEIPAGAHLLLRFINSVSTATAKTGDFVYMTTASPVSVENAILIPVGAHVQGVVAHARRSGKVSGRAELAIRIETLTLSNGKTFRFSPNLSSVDNAGSAQKVEGKESSIKQGSGSGRDVARVAIFAGTGASLGGMADRSWSGAGIGAGIGAGVGMAARFLTRGKEVELRSGSTLDVVFSRRVPLE